MLIAPMVARPPSTSLSRQRASGSFSRRVAHAAVLVGLAGTFVTSPALAQPAAAPSAEDKAGARAAANAGADAFEAEDFEKAADFFGRAEGIIHSPVHELYIARSYAKLARLVEARELLLKIQRADENSKITGDASDELKKVEARLPRVALEVTGAGEATLELTVDGKAFRATLLGIAQPFDPGEHTAIVTASGKEPVTHKFSVEESAKQTVTIDVSQALAIAPVPVSKDDEKAAEEAKDEPKDEPAAEEQAPSESEEDGGSNTGLRIGGYVALGVGAVSIGVGTVFAIEAGALTSDVNFLCDEIDEREGTTECAGRTEDEEFEIYDYEDDVSTAKTTAIVGFAIGGVAVAAGVTMLILSASGKKQSVSYKGIELRPALGYKYLGLSGSF